MPSARKEFAIAITKVDINDLVAACERYARTKPPKMAWLNPATYLRQERWLDERGPRDGIAGALDRLHQEIAERGTPDYSLPSTSPDNWREKLERTKTANAEAAIRDILAARARRKEGGQ